MARRCLLSTVIAARMPWLAPAGLSGGSGDLRFVAARRRDRDRGAMATCVAQAYT